MTAWASTGPNTLVLYDRLWHGAIALNTTGSQSITGAPSRYTGTNARGNIAFIETTTTLANTAHTWTLNYTDEGGTARSTQATGIAAAAATRIDHTQWYIPLVANTYGIQAATSISLSATLASGAAALVIGHPLLFVPLPTSGYQPVVLDDVNPILGRVQVQTGAALAFLAIRGQASATSYGGQVIMVSG